MQKITDYDKVFGTLIEKTEEYVVGNDLNCMVVGISGGIDSTVVAAICHEVSKRTNIPLIGRSLPTKFNKEDEITTAQLVGKAFCNDFEEVPIKNPYESFLSLLDRAECGMTAVANGNIQARFRMMYLYNLASIHKGLVMDTDNLTENNLGYFTIHGDVGDFNPIGGLWKTEVFKLAEWLMNWYGSYTHTYFYTDAPEIIDYKQGNLAKAVAIKESLKLKPTAGLGITNNDLEEIGAESYEQVDDVLEVILAWKMITASSKYNFYNFIISDFMTALAHIPEEIIRNVAKRHFASEFKRKQLPIKITRDEIV